MRLLWARSLSLRGTSNNATYNIHVKKHQGKQLSVVTALATERTIWWKAASGLADTDFLERLHV